MILSTLELLAFHGMGDYDAVIDEEDQGIDYLQREEAAGLEAILH